MRILSHFQLHYRNSVTLAMDQTIYGFKKKKTSLCPTSVGSGPVQMQCSPSICTLKKKKKKRSEGTCTCQKHKNRDRKGKQECATLIGTVIPQSLFHFSLLLAYTQINACFFKPLGLGLKLCS